jgi:Kef-type K+ transport system membrane component KefB/mannitol/fructose-specific phosphotransferase system IIA component (Ntr-type)
MEVTVLQEHSMLLLLEELFLLLLFARGLGELFRRFGQPSVVGEILAGVLLGPTIFGALWPEMQLKIFPADPLQRNMQETIYWLGALFLLMVAGMEVDLSVIRKQGKSAFLISATRIVVAFTLGFLLGMYLPESYMPATASRIMFASLLGILCAISAVPILARILHELGMLKSDIGLLALSSSTLTDFICWIFFTVLAGLAAGESVKLHEPIMTILWVSTVVVLVLSIGRTAVNWVIRRVKDEPTWQSGSVMVFAFLLALGLACICQIIGIHAMFGFFLAGILIGDSPYVTLQTRESISAFVLSLFSPLFFASIGLKINFFANFDPILVLLVFVVMAGGRMLGVFYGARLSRMSSRDSLPVAAGMLAGGVMEVIISLLGLQLGLMTEKLFVAVVVVAIVNSIIAGPLMAWLLKLRAEVDLTSILPREAIVPNLHAANIRDAVANLLPKLGDQLKPYSVSDVVHAVLSRESLGSTALGDQLAVPHARLEQLSKPILAVARIESGMHMDSPDGQDVHLIFLLLTPASNLGLQVQILAGICGAFHDPHLREKLLTCDNDKMEGLLMQALRQHKIPHTEMEAVTK